MPNRFCAICGNKLVEEDPHFGMCLKCYLKENPLFKLANTFSLNICLDCGNYSKKEDWIKPQENELFTILEEAIERFLLKPFLKKNNIEFSISFNEESFIFSSKDLLVSLEAIIQGVLKRDFNLKHQEIIKLNINHTLCTNCANLRGGMYFLSIIQLRVKNENQFDLIKKVLDEISTYIEELFDKDRRQYISKIENQKYGVDLYLSTNELMNHLVKFLKTKYNFLFKRSKKLVGRDIQKGQNLYRFKSLIKFLPFNKNDQIFIENQIYVVENITKNKVVLRSQNKTKLIKDYSYFFSENIIIKSQ
ncbi:MAG: NMD3-related protein [Candidatus Hermodarchaeota archaeon]